MYEYGILPPCTPIYLYGVILLPGDSFTSISIDSDLDSASCEYGQCCQCFRVHAAFIFRVEMSRVGECSCVQ
jgi:hypothetical protein